jgi:hypothetical protein
MADKKRSLKHDKPSKKIKPPKPLPPLEIVRVPHADFVEYCWKPILHEPIAKPQGEFPGQVLYQLDPGYLQYAIFNVQIHCSNALYWFAKMLSTRTPVGGYPGHTEGWRFSLQTLTTVLTQANALTLSGSQYDSTQTPLATYWFPPEPGWLNNEFTMPTTTTYPPATHMANQPVLFEAPFGSNYKMRLGFNLGLNAQGRVTGTLTWFHNKPNFTGYLITPYQAYWFTRLTNPQWPGQWYEDFYQSPP